MNGKTKTQKGITLMALIITIVVLLILAAVAISSITNDGILSYAMNAASKFNEAQANEQNILSKYEEYINNESSNNEGSSDEGSNNEDTQTLPTLKISISNEITEERVHMEDASGFDISNPYAPYNTTYQQTFEYEENMTWREWVNSSYNSNGFKIITTTNAGAGISGECIVSSDSDANDGYQLRKSYICIAYTDSTCNQIAQDEDGIAGSGKVCFEGDDLIDLDEKIADTLNNLKSESEQSGYSWTEMNKYLKSEYFLAFCCYDD